MQNYTPHQLLQIVMALMTFALGWLTLAAGVIYILSRDIRSAVSKASARSADVRRKALLDVSLSPTLESASQLVDAVNRMIGTAVGVGAFMCLVGVVLCIAGFLMLEGGAP